MGLLSLPYWTSAQNTFPASGSVGIGTTTPNASSILDITSTAKGVLLPRMTKTQRNAIGTPATGLLIFQTDNTKGLYYYSGADWLPVNNVRGLNSNCFIGLNAGGNNAGGTGNIALGKAALKDNTNRIENIAIGDSSQKSTGVGSIGNQAYYNTSVGSKSLRFNTTGARNATLGAYSQYSNIAGNDNSVVGYQAMFYNQYGNFCSAVGYQSLFNNQATYNTAVGNMAGYNHVYGESNSFFGDGADQSGTTTYQNSTAIGNASTITGDGQVRIGQSIIASIGGFAAWSNLSDGRYKKDVKENVPGLDFINKLKPVTYHLDVTGLQQFLHEDRIKVGRSPEYVAAIEKATAEKEKVLFTGFIAQDVEKAALESGYDFSGVDKPKNEQSLYALRYAEFTVPLVKAVQELSAVDKTKEDRLARLEKENKELRQVVNDMQKVLQAMNANPAQKQAAGMTSSFSIVPNPAGNQAEIRFRLSGDNQSAGKIIITDARGSVVRTISTAGNTTGSLLLRTEGMASGQYQVQFWNGNTLIETQQLVVNR